MYAR